MPAYQSVPEFNLSEKYHLKAVGCERCAKSDPIKPPNRNGNNWLRSGIRWRIKPLNSRALTILNLSEQIPLFLTTAHPKSTTRMV
jgi:hypothetical protein